MPLGEILLPAGAGVPGAMTSPASETFLMEIGGVEGCGLVEPVIEIVEQRAVHAEAGVNHRLALAERIPGHAHARLRQEFGAVHGEHGISHQRVGVDHAVASKTVVGRPAVRFVPAVGGFDAESDPQLQIRPQLDHILRETGAFERPPAERRRRRNYGEGRDGALEERAQAAEGGLAVLVLRQVVIGSESRWNQTPAENWWMPCVKRHVVVVSKQVPHRAPGCCPR